jgi:hypothetical protein
MGYAWQVPMDLLVSMVPMAEMRRRFAQAVAIPARRREE